MTPPPQRAQGILGRWGWGNGSALPQRPPRVTLRAPEAPRLPGTEQLGQGGQAWPPGLSTGTSGTGGPCQPDTHGGHQRDLLPPPHQPACVSGAIATLRCDSALLSRPHSCPQLARPAPCPRPAPVSDALLQWHCRQAPSPQGRMNPPLRVTVASSPLPPRPPARGPPPRLSPNISRP